MEINEKLRKNTLILSICTILNKGLMFVMVPLFTRWLTVEDYGTYDVLATYVSLLIPIVTLSSSNAVFRLSVDAKEDLRKAYIVNGFYMVLINLIISVSILSVLHKLFAFSVFIPFVFMIICEVVDNYFQGYLRALKKLSIYGVCKSATTLCSAVMITLFVKGFQLGLTGLIFGYSVGYLLSTIVIIIVTKFWKCFSDIDFSLNRMKELVSYSWALIPNDISWWIINVSDRQIINMFLGASANGIYAVAYKIPNLCSSVFSVFNISWQESATDVLNEENKTQYYNQVYNSMIRVLLSLCIGIVSCNFIFFDYLFDPRYTSARLYSPILVASIIFSTLSAFFGGIQISLKRPKANGFSTVIGAIANLLINIGLVKFVGLYAAAISTLVSNIVVMLIRKATLKKDIKVFINKKYYLFMVLFIYYCISSMFKLTLVYNLLNLLFATVIFIYLNFHFIKKMLSKLGFSII